MHGTSSSRHAAHHFLTQSVPAGGTRAEEVRLACGEGLEAPGDAEDDPRVEVHFATPHGCDVLRKQLPHKDGR